MTTEHRKLNIIQQISVLSDDTLLDRIEALLHLKTDNSAFLQKYVRPIRKVTNLEKMIVEKQYTGVDKTVIQSVVKTIDIPQETDELLQMLD